MHILCTGLNHHSAPVEVRERVAFSGERFAAALDDIRSLPGVEQAALLCTCNRTEVYTVGAGDAGACVRAWMIARSGLSPDVVWPHIYEMAGRDAAIHLCCVAGGVDSQVVGESEILGQVKAAMKAAKECGALGRELEKMFSAAVNCGKRARTETGIGRGAFSVGRCAVDKAKRVFGCLDGRAILILGAGKIAEGTARHLRAQGAAPILVANRTHSRAQELARELGGQAMRYDQLAEALVQADIVISSTSAPHFVLLPEQVTEAMRRREGRGLFLIDIAVPRDIDPQVAATPGVHLYNIDDLGGGVEEAAESRAGEVAAAKRIAGEAAEEFWQWLAARQATPLVAALREHFEDAREEQLSKFAAKIESLSPADRKLVEQVTRGVVKRLLHNPTVRLKEELMRGNGHAADALARVFDLDPGSGKAERRR
ncbi:MAG: glutamyl-tRNA reductase [Armatimonadota bacterium]|nr:MAG: glutamyl-tRNA reductase [Armatimonadota bacterium]